MTGAPLRVATWNLERPKPNGWKIPPAQRERMAEVDADIWVLTETIVSQSPGSDYEGVFCPEAGDRAQHERMAAVWSRWPIEQLPHPDPDPGARGSVAARVDAPSGPVLVYGTVLAWANEPNHDDGTKARMWDVHRAEVDRQGAEWAKLRSRYPDLPLIVAGDFNQDRDGSNWYGTVAVRSALTEQLDNAGLRCVTDTDVVAATRRRPPHRPHLRHRPLRISAAAVLGDLQREWRPSQRPPNRRGGLEVSRSRALNGDAVDWHTPAAWIYCRSPAATHWRNDLSLCLGHWVFTDDGFRR